LLQLRDVEQQGEMGSASLFDSPGFYIAILSIINLMSFMDRGIIPGATDEFTHFIDNTIHTNTPSLYIGLLQSSFIIGISLSSPIFASLAHTRSPFLLVAWGMLGWTVAAGICGLAITIESYEFLIFGRILSGVGEAAFVCCTAPWIILNAPAESKSSWLAIFYTTTPVGTALGYIYSSIISNAIGVRWAFFIEAVYMIPFLFFLFFMAKKFPLLPSGMSHFPLDKGTGTGAGVRGDLKTPLLDVSETSEDRLLPSSPTLHSPGDSQSTTSSDDQQHQNRPPTIWEESVIVCSYPCFVYLTLGYSALTGTLIGLATFGSSFFLALDYFDSEVAASSVFGILVSVAGIIGFPLGGLFIDAMSKHHHKTLSPSAETNAAIFIETPKETLRDEETTEKTTTRKEEEVATPFSHTLSSSPEAFSQHKKHHNDGEEEEEGEGETEEDETKRFSYIKNLTDLYCSSYVMTISSIFGLFLMSAAYFAHDVASALTVIFFGTIFLFICNSSASIGVVYSIPIQHRPFGLAFNLIGMHMLGDVPSPLIAGYLKDTLAPGCVGDDDEVSTSTDCHNDEHGIRLTMLVISLWLVWCGVFFGFSTLHAKKTLDTATRREMSSAHLARPSDLKR
jgi:MFS transporter, Spinster family, sphingosine-1-phosphate transporter